MSTELHGLPVRCSTSFIYGLVGVEYSSFSLLAGANEFSTFNPPSGQQCGEYAAAFVQQAGGYIDNLNATVACKYCTYSVGDEFYTPLTITFGHRWRDLGILIAFVGFNIILVRFSQHEQFFPLTNTAFMTCRLWLLPNSSASLSARHHGILFLFTLRHPRLHLSNQYLSRHVCLRSSSALAVNAI